MAGKRVSSIRLFKTADWTHRDLPGLQQNPEMIRYSNNGKYLALLQVRDDGLSDLKIFDVQIAQVPQLVRTIIVEQIVDRMDCFAFCPTGAYLVIGWNLGEKLRVYKTSDWTIVNTAFDDLWLERTLVNGIKFSANGTRLYVCGTTSHPDGAIAVYDMVNWVRLPEYKVPEVTEAFWMDVSSVKSQMALYDGRNLRLINTLNWTIGHEEFIDDGGLGYTGVDYNEDGSMVAVTGGPTGALVFNTTTFLVENDLTEMGANRGGSAVFDKRLPVAEPFSRVDNPEIDLGRYVIPYDNNSEYLGLGVFQVNDDSLTRHIAIEDEAAALSVTAEELSFYSVPVPFISADGNLVVSVHFNDNWPGNGGG